jgi:RNA polymerase sigma factor (sigma-70 family)
MPLEIVLDYLKTIGAAAEMHHWPDAVLLERFVHRRDEAAFAMLLHRHGPMVLGVCRRVLGDVHDAEDAFQATFVVLARRAGSLRGPAQLGPWLYSVAQRVAWKARARAAARHRRQRELTDMPHAEPLDDRTWHELRPVLDEEIGRLPEKYRAAVILCYLQGKTHEQAAQELGWPRTSLTNRLARARDLLRSQLTGRGIVLSAGALVTALTEKTAPAAVGATLTIHTAKAAAGVAAGEAVATSILSTQALALAEEVMGGMMGVKAKVVILALALGVTLGGGAMASYRGLVGPAPDGAIAVGQPSPMPRAAQPPLPRVDAEGVPLPPGVLARIGSSRFRHMRGIFGVTVSPDGRTIASVGFSGFGVWEAATGRLIRFVPARIVDAGHQLAFAADGHDLLCLIVTPEPTFLRLDPATGRELLRLDLKNEHALRAWIAPSGRYFAFIRLDKSLHICDAQTGREIRSFANFANPNSHLDISLDDRVLAVTNRADTITLYDATTGAKTGELKHEKVTFQFLAFSPDGRTLAAYGNSVNDRPRSDYVESSEIHLWDIATRQYRGQLQGNDADLGHGFQFSPDGKTLATASRMTDPILWDVATGQELRRFRGARGSHGITFSPNGKVLVVGTDDGTVLLWDLETGQPLPASASPMSSLRVLRYTSDGRPLIGQAERITVWDPTTGREVRRYADVPAVIGNTALSPDARFLAGVDLTWFRGGGSVRVWDAATGREVRRMAGEQRIMPSVPVFTPDGRQLIATDVDNRIVVWDFATGQTLGTLTGHGGRGLALAMSPDGRRLASVSPNAQANDDKTIRVWDLTTYQEIRRLTPRRGDVAAAAFSPDGRRLATGGGYWDARPQVPPNGAGDIYLWDLDSGRALRSFVGHTDRVTRVAFSPDGRMLATGGGDTTVRVWEVASGGERQCFTGHTAEIASLAFAPDGRTLAASSAEAPVYIWDVNGRLEPPAQPPTAADLEQAWTALASADAKAAFDAIRRLVATPEPTVAFLRERLPPAAAVNAQWVRDLIRQLDSPRFAERQRATAELEKLADAAAAELKAALNDAPPLEVRLTVPRILERTASVTPESLRALRAVEALEYIATPAARAHLKALAGGAAGATVTDAAAQALKRLEAR